MNADIMNLLRDLADSEDEFLHEGSSVVLTHHGRERSFEISQAPGIGPALRVENTTDEWLPVHAFVQKNILDLSRLAGQISKTLINKHKAQSITKFIDGSATITDERDNQVVGSSAKEVLNKLLLYPGINSTQLVELMAPAGQGKTVLLEHIAIEAASNYQPVANPYPLFLVVDLLGRYVGTIHDAIAGSLNNTYIFPALTGRDVVLCLRQRWMNLALDGFDELVARVGAREAFLRVKEFVDDLHESGTIILSARDSFFRLFEIDSSIRTYLQPKRGAYSIYEIELDSWGREQAKSVFSAMMSKNPQADLDGLLSVFADDESIVYRPFFTIKLAKAWMDGERFADIGGKHNPLGRWDYVLRVFIKREVEEKWKSRDDATPLLKTDDHITMLGGVAEEMWRSGAFALTKEEVEIAGRIGLDESNMNDELIDDVIKRLPSHGVFTSLSNKTVKFIHDNFFFYFLGLRLGSCIINKYGENARAIICAAEIPPMVLKWAVWKMNENGNLKHDELQWLLDECCLFSDRAYASINVASLISEASRINVIGKLWMRGMEFTGEALKAVTYETVKFTECSFWTVNMSSSQFHNCEFEKCEFSSLHFDDVTEFTNSEFRNCTYKGLEITGEPHMYAPKEMMRELEKRGARITPSIDESIVVNRLPERKVQKEVVRCIDKMRRAKTWDIAKDDIQERFHYIGETVIRYGLETGVFKMITRGASGPNAEFVRFSVDREKLFAGQLGPTGDSRIDALWEKLIVDFPEEQ